MRRRSLHPLYGEERHYPPCVEKESLSSLYIEEELPCSALACCALALALPCPCVSLAHAHAYALPSLILAIDEMSFFIIIIERRESPGKARHDMAKLALLCLDLPCSALTSHFHFYTE